VITDFSTAIAQACVVKQQTMELDKRKIWPYHLPQPAVTDEQILRAEQYLGHPIDARHKVFLKCANGWPAFYQTVDLFGTTDLIGGPRNECGEFLLSCLDQSVLKRSGLARCELLPLAATKSDRDLFVITRPNSSSPGMVIWFAGEEIDRFVNFDEYFLAMCEYNSNELQNFQQETI
jgi:hypothetical protein